VRWRGTRADLRAKLKAIPRVLAGLDPDPLGLHPLFWGTIANGALAACAQDYADKLAGGTGRFDGVKWAQLAVATLAKRKRAGNDDESILVETGTLLASLQPGIDEHPNARAPDQVFVVRRAGVEVGTADPKADWHEAGIPGRMPARTVMPPEPLPAAWEAELERVALGALQKVIEKLVESGGG
jgi:hypothetical protein